MAAVTWRRKEDRHGSEMVLRKEQKRRRKELKLDRIISSWKDEETENKRILNETRGKEAEKAHRKG